MGRPFAEEESVSLSPMPWERSDEATFADERLEAQLLSALHNEPSLAARIDPEWFQYPLHVEIARGMVALVRAGETRFEPTALFAAIGKRAKDKLEGLVIDGKAIDTVGGFVTWLRNQAGFAVSAERLLSDVRANWMMRQLRQVGAYSNGGSPSDNLAIKLERIEALRKTTALTAPGMGFVDGSTFIAGRPTPDYVVDGLLQRGFVYALTAQPGAGKTALALRLCQCISVGAPFGPHELRQGHAWYFCGENPEDVQDRLIGVADTETIDLSRLHFFAGITNLANLMPSLQGMIREGDLIVVDTSPAYYPAEDENDNPAMLAHARMLRQLAKLPSRPAVLALCHPNKGAEEKEKLIPRGGSAFWGELDGNLSAWKDADNGMVELHYVKKLRGAPHFDPLMFKLESVYCDRLVDARGRPMATVTARYADAHAESMTRSHKKVEQDLILLAILAGKRSNSEIAGHAALFSDSGPAAYTVTRRCQEMVKGGKGKALVEKDREDKWVLTAYGKKVAEGLKREEDALAANNKRYKDD